MKGYILLHERTALATFDSHEKAKKFLKKIVKQKEWISNEGRYFIVEVKESILVH